MNKVKLAAKHSGMKVDYTGLLGQVIRAVKSKASMHAEMLRQLQAHITELGRRYYSGDVAGVDEFLQLYCVEQEAREKIVALQSMPEIGEFHFPNANEMLAIDRLEGEIIDYQAEIESLKKVPVFNRLTHKIVPIEPTIEMIKYAHSKDCVWTWEEYRLAYKNMVAAAPEYQDSELPAPEGE